MSSVPQIYLQTELYSLHTSPPQKSSVKASTPWDFPPVHLGMAAPSSSPTAHLCVLNIAWHTVSSSKQETWIVGGRGWARELFRNGAVLARLFPPARSLPTVPP